MALKFTPDDYRREPELWLANQTGHMMLGIIIATVSCYFYFKVFGEFPYRHIVFALVVFFYGVWVELIGQGWQGFDTIEDNLFVSVYGAGSVMYAFREVEPGSSVVYADLNDIELFIYVVPIHLLVGALWRVRNKKRERRDG